VIVPAEWFVVFKKKSKLRWVNWVPGRFKHCFAMAFIAEIQCWAFVEFAATAGSTVALLPNDQADDWLAEAMSDAVVVKYKAGAVQGAGWGLWCVPLTAHVIGVSSCALLPDGLFRDVMRNGGEVVISGD
jgi:hypothetical protein